MKRNQVDLTTVHSDDKQTKIVKISKREIAIIGMSVKLPLIEDTDDFWRQLQNGADLIRDFPETRKSDTNRYLRYVNKKSAKEKYTQFACLEAIDQFDYRFFKLSLKEAALMDPGQRLFLETAWQVMEDAGYGGEKLKGSRTGVYVGFNSLSSSKYGSFIAEVDPPSQAMALPGNLPLITASRISYLMDLRGPAVIIDTACSSSLVAVHFACQAIRNDECEMAIAGGVRVNLLPLESEEKLGIEASDGKTKSFDDSSDGTGSGEGVLAILLKPLSKALMDHDHIYAVIKGSAINQDGSSVGITAPNPAAQEDVIVRAWQDARIDPGTITLIEAHGTGTKLGDPIEIDGITRAFRQYTDKRQFCAVGSVKTNLGHLDSAAGIAGLVKAVLSLKYRQLPPSLHFQKPNRRIDFIDSPIYVNNRLNDWQTEVSPRRCGVSSFGLGGTNCHLVLEEYIPAETPAETTMKGSAPLLLVLSAKGETALRELLKKYAQYLQKQNNLELIDLCYTAGTGRGHYSHRLALIFTDLEELILKVESLIAQNSLKNSLERIYYGEHQVVVSSDGFEHGDFPERLLTVQRITDLNRMAEEKVAQFQAEKNVNQPVILDELARLYTSGAEVNWEDFYQKIAQKKRIRIPVYPFERKRCWLEIPEPALKKNWFHQVKWVPQNLQPASGKIDGNLLIFKDESGFSNRLTSGLIKSGATVIEVEHGPEFRRINDHLYLTPPTQDGYRSLFQELKEWPINRIIHLGSMAKERKIENLFHLEEALQKGVYNFLHLVKALLTHCFLETELVLIAENVHEVTGFEVAVYPENAPLFGLGKTVGMEQLNINCRCLDLDQNTDPSAILLELEAGRDHLVAYRDGWRYLPEISQVDLQVFPEKEILFKEDGVYLITGGTGLLGLKIAKFIASKNKVNLALVNRSGFPARNKWEELLNRGADRNLIGKLQAIREIEVGGAQVDCYRADVSVQEELAETLCDLRKKYGRINGIIHCAGVGVQTEGTPLTAENESSFRAKLLPKVQGTWLLDQLTAEDQPDFLILFSSIITLIGGVGAGSYTAANSYLDSYTAYRRRRGQKTLTINWCAWEETVQSSPHIQNQARHLFKYITTDDALNAFAKIFSKDCTRVLIGDFNHDCDLFALEEYLPFKLSTDLQMELNQTNPGRKLKETVGQTRVNLRGRLDQDYTFNEKKFAQVLADVLAFEEINIYDNLYELGLDSITALKVINYLEKKLEVKTEITDLLRHPSVHAFSKYLDTRLWRGEKRQKQIDRIRKAAFQEYYPLSSAQKRLYILNQLEGNHTTYHITLTQILTGRIDRKRLATAFEILVERHEVFRTSFEIHADEPVQRIHQKVNFKVEYREAVPEKLDETIGNLMIAFDFKTAPLFRVTLVKLEKERHLLIFDLHHIIADAVSLEIILQELVALYCGQLLPELSLQYKDYAVWQQEPLTKESLQKQEKYWLEALGGALPVLQMPVDYPRPVIQNFAGDRIYLEAGRGLTEKLNRLASRENSTLFMLLTAVYGLLLSRYAGQEEIIIGTPVAGRSRADLEMLVGMFVNTLAFKILVKSGKSFSEYLGEVREQTWKAFENQEYQFDDLVEKLELKRDLSRNPVFDVVFSMLNVKNRAIAIEDLEFIPFEFKNPTSKFDLTLTAFEKTDGLHFELEYCTSLWKRSTVEKLADHFLNILNEVTINPNQKLSMIEILSREEKKKIVYDLNNTQTEYPRNATISQLFEAQSKKTPDQVALDWDSGNMTYRALNQKANQLTRALRRQGVKPGNIVGLFVNRSPAMILGILGILKAGGAYLPLDPQYPVERLQYMLEDSGTTVLCQGGKVPTLEINSLGIINIGDDGLFEGDQSDLENGASPSNLAYVLYTSGSTGKPKGVMIEHRSVVNFLSGITARIDFSPGKNILALTTVSFDIFVLETLAPLTRGLKVVIADENQQKDPRLLLELISVKRINMLQATPSSLQMLLFSSENIFLDSVSELMVGGEPLSKSLLTQLKKICRGRIYNLYGPTETTVWSAISELTEEEEVDIGIPLANTSVYVLSREGQIQPYGVAGELWIGGEGVARGYLNRPELTAEKFAPNPFHSLQCTVDSGQLNKNNSQLSTFNAQLKKDSRLYKTGDLARWRSNGKLEFLGRLDNQVKIRGFRIELGEIEAALLTHPLVSEAVVKASEDQFGNKYLAAYFTGSNELAPQMLREHLIKHLPGYMIPSFIVNQEKMPLTANGKIDRNRLPEPEITKVDSESDLTLGDLWEVKMARIWLQLLGVKQVQVNENFFELGGHSLKATMLSSLIHREFNVTIPLWKIFQSPTIKELTEYVKTAPPCDYEPIPLVREQDFYPISAAQKRLFILNQLDPGSIAYNMPIILQIEGFLAPERLEEALKNLIHRHEALRTSFSLNHGEPAQRINEKIDFRMVMTSDLAPEDLPAKIVEFVRPFELSMAPLYRVELVRFSEKRHLLMVDLHHLICDLISLNILVEELFDLYQGASLPKPVTQYKDYAVWQNRQLETALNKKQEEFWVNLFQGEIPFLNLPYDYPRPVVQSYQGESLGFEIKPELTSALKRIAGKTGTTLYMVLLSVYYILLHKYSGQENIVVGTPVSGRRHADIQKVVGIFINTLPLRNYPLGRKAFLEFLTEVKENIINAFDNQDYQFEMLVDRLPLKRDLSRNPLFDTMFVFQKTDRRETGFPDLKITSYPYKSKVAKFDLTLSISEGEKSLTGELEYCTKLFNPETAARLIRHFLQIASAVITNPEQKIRELILLSEEERRQTLVDFNATQMSYPHGKTIPDLFGEQAARTPEKTALVCGDQEFTYRELNARAGQVAAVLRSKGVRPDQIVGLLTKRTPEMLVGILGILKAGGAYLPLDPDFPEDRIRYMLEDSGVAIVVITSFQLQPDYYSLLSPDRIIDLSDWDWKGEENGELKTICRPENLAYVIYTSGSTGQPKGMMIEHRAVVNFILGITEIINFAPEKTILALTTVSFDIFVLETLLPLTRGLKVALADEGEQRDSRLLYDMLLKNQVDMLQLTPSRLQLFLSDHGSAPCLSHLTEIMVGGEAFPSNLAVELSKISKARIYNMYGPTETTVWSTVMELIDPTRILVGKPVANTRIYIMDGNQNPQPIGIVGELCIAGAGLARGYFNRPELTAERFTPDPFVAGERLYRTGDLARWLPDGTLQLFGRLDRQVKIRGNRIEPEEIEKVLKDYPGVKSCVVVTKVKGAGERYLAGYYVAEYEIPVTDLRTHLARRLPGYMIPEAYVLLEELPLTPNGKIDQRALPEPEPNRPKLETEYCAADTATETVLVKIWQDILKRDRIGIHDNFFDLGGNSMGVVILRADLAERYSRKVSVADIFSYPTIAELSRFIDETPMVHQLPLQVKPLVFPEDYFLSKNEENESDVLYFTVEHNLNLILAEAARRKKMELFDIYLALYLFLLREITGQTEVTVVACDRENFWYPVTINFREITDFEPLFSKVAQKRRNLGSGDTYPVSQLNRFLMVNQTSGAIVPVIVWGNEPVAKPTSSYDLIMKLDLEGDWVNINFEYNAQKLRKNKIKDLANGYRKLTAAFAKEYQNGKFQWN